MSTATSQNGALPTQQPAKRPRRKKWWRELGWRHAVGVVGVIYAGFPIIYILSASLNPSGTLTGSNQIFASIAGQNYADLTSTKFLTWSGNRLMIGVVTSIDTVLMSAARSEEHTSELQSRV